MPKASDMRSEHRKLLIVCGPTATGKTKLAIFLAKQFNGELISADSRQIYKGLDVLSGKDIPQNAIIQPQFSVSWKGQPIHLGTYIVSGVPIWLYDVVASSQRFSVALYQTLASAVVGDIYKRGKLPILVGGTGLYISSVVSGIATANIPPDPTLRSFWETKSLSLLQQEVMKTDPDRWGRMNNSDRHNPRRLIRALETARKPTEKPVADYDALWVGLRLTQEEMRHRIVARVEERWNHGAIDEVHNIKKNISRSLPAISALGVRPILDYLLGRVGEDEAKKLWAEEEFHYAQRQMTWFKKNTSIHWYAADSQIPNSLVENTVSEWYTH